MLSFITIYHRKTVKVASKSQAVELNLEFPSNSDSKKEKLCNHSYNLDYEASTKRASVRKGANWMVITLLLGLSALVIVGCSIPSFHIEILGIVGIAVESGQQFEEAKTLYSVFDLAKMIMNQGRYLGTTSDLVGLATLASLLVMTVFIVPLAQAASMAVQWFSPLTKEQRSYNTIFNEVMSAWIYMEVYVLSIVITAWQLGGVSEFMLNEQYCGGLKSMFLSLAHFGILAQEDAQCFRVKASPSPLAGSWVLLTASLVLVLLNHFVGSNTSQKARDDKTPANKRRYTDRWSKVLGQSTTTMTNDYGSTDDDESITKAVKVSPIQSRFTDYYCFVIAHKSVDGSDSDEESAVETAVLDADESV